MAPSTVRSSRTRKTHALLPVLEPKQPVEDRSTRVSAAAGAGLISMQPATQTCSLCEDEAGAQGLPYRIVLRCTVGET